MVAFTSLALISLVLVLQIIPVGLQGALAADRLLYLPLAGLVLALAIGAPRDEAKAPRPREALVLALGFAFAAAIRSLTDLSGDDDATTITLLVSAIGALAGSRVLRY